MPATCASYSIEYLLNLVTHDYMLLIMVQIVYYFAFVGETVAFDLIGQLSGFTVWQYLFCILYQQTFQRVF